MKAAEQRIFEGDFISACGEVPNGGYDLCIADPPYFKVVGEKWDYQWRTVDEYLEWSGRWIAKANASIRYGGTLCLFGYPEMLARLLPVCDSCGLKFRQQIVIDKGIYAVAGRATKKYKMFPNCTESIFVFVKDPLRVVRDELIEAKNESGLTAKEINSRLGVKSNGGGMWSIWTGDNVCAQMPTREMWDALEKVFSRKFKARGYAQKFNPQMGLTDVWRDISFRCAERRIHPTQKPSQLIERIVTAYTDEGDSVLDPFGGSCTTAVVCASMNRNCDCHEIEHRYVEAARKRLDLAKNRIQLALEL